MLKQECEKLLYEIKVVPGPIDQGKAKPEMVPKAKTVREFDDAITIHSFGEC